ncbi:kinesin-like protein KIN-14R isoform X2 [Coffea arabica]|nr:kinesin-like protein KIN-14R isoform X2 [Coffea arabica]
MSDHGFDGGNVLKTNESVIDDSNFGALYQSARIGNFSYQFENLPAGDYFVDLHFAEIINTNGPKGMRVFDVFIQEDKILSELDIYSLIGANKPLQLEDVRISLGPNDVIMIRFQGLNGSPIVSGICIREAPNLPVSLVKQRCPETENLSFENKDVRARNDARYQRKMEELQAQCERKTDECYQAWMSLTDMSKKLEEVTMELDNKSFQNNCLDQSMVLQAEKLKDVSTKYNREKKFWFEAINKIESKVKILKDEQSKLSRETHDCANLIPDLNKMVSAVQGLVAQCENLKLKCSKEQAERKKLYNQIQQTKGNIRVFCRSRPLSREEASAGYATVTDFDGAKDGDLGIVTSGFTKKTYRFDRVYMPKDNQDDVFADASPLVISVLDGYNVCIFAYGQTGTGKTFTMEGIENNRGVNYRTLELLFRMIEERKDAFTYNVSVNVLEVYNEQIRDLLVNSPASKKLEIRQDIGGINHVPGIVNAEVENIREVWNVLQAGSNARAVGSNNVNEHSSRSHCMICITVRARNSMNGECTKSKLWLVDLAGSERLAKTDVQGERRKEAQNINRSLSALGDVISALASKSSHIPYRNSKLTHLLQDSLGGEAKILMFVQISPLEQDLGETLSSLNFATRVRGVELGPAKKQIDFGEIQKLKLLLDKLKQESRTKDDALRKLEENFHALESQAKNKDQFCRNQQEKVNELESQLAMKADSCSQMDRQLTELSMKVRVGEDIRANLQQKVNQLEKKLIECEHVESNALQHKVKQLERTLKERTNEFEVHSVILQKKVKELEHKLERQGGGTTVSPMLRPKIQELQEKVSQRDRHLESSPELCASEQSRASTDERKDSSSITENEVNTGPGTQMLQPRKRPTGQGSILLKGNESLGQLRMKREFQNKGIENICLSNPSTEKKRSLATESNKGRHIDPTKAFARVTRTTKPFPGIQRSLSSRINREPVPMVKERESSTRVWLR